jgi:hypothetical protein
MSDENSKPSEHLAVLLGEQDGGRQVVYEADGQVKVGLLKPLEEGKPLDSEGELVEVETDGFYAKMRNHGRVGRATSRGPAIVNDDAYRASWERVFGNKKSQPDSKAN